jgi:hypothetical protein
MDPNDDDTPLYEHIKLFWTDSTVLDLRKRDSRRGVWIVSVDTHTGGMFL